MEIQQVFEKVCRHFATQNKRAICDVSKTCMYRHGALSCAVGCLIHDEHYGPELENLRSSEEKVIAALEKSGIVHTPEVSNLLMELQCLHDGNMYFLGHENEPFVDNQSVQVQLAKIASRMNLEFKPVEWGLKTK